MKFKKIIAVSILSAISMQVCASEDDNKITENEIKNRILSMIISPYAKELSLPGTPIDTREKFPPNMIIYKDASPISCEIKIENSFNFTDFEGSSFGNFEEEFTKLPHATDRVKERVFENNQEITQNEDDIIASFKLLKEKYCIDTIFAPVIDYRTGGRYHFNKRRHSTEEDWFTNASKELDFWMEQANEQGLAFTIKHYPFTTPVETTEDDHKSILQKYEKEDKYMNGVPKEVTIDTIKPNNEFHAKSLEEVKQRTYKLMENRSENNMVMLTNRIIREYGYKPYIFTEEPQKDPFLQNFKGLIVSDDLFQLSLDEERALKAFKNIDIAIISGIKDLRIYVESIAKHAFSDPEILKMVIDKSNKVRAFKERRKNLDEK